MNHLMAGFDMEAAVPATTSSIQVVGKKMVKDTGTSRSLTNSFHLYLIG